MLIYSVCVVGKGMVVEGGGAVVVVGEHLSLDSSYGPAPTSSYARY